MRTDLLRRLTRKLHRKESLPNYFPNPIYCKNIELVYANYTKFAPIYIILSQPVRDNSPVSPSMKTVLSISIVQPGAPAGGGQ